MASFILTSLYILMRSMTSRDRRFYHVTVRSFYDLTLYPLSSQGLLRPNPHYPLPSQGVTCRPNPLPEDVRPFHGISFFTNTEILSFTWGCRVPIRHWIICQRVPSPHIAPLTLFQDYIFIFEKFYPIMILFLSLVCLIINCIFGFFNCMLKFCVIFILSLTLLLFLIHFYFILLYFWEIFIAFVLFLISVLFYYSVII